MKYQTIITELEAQLGKMISLMKQFHVDPRLQAIVVSRISRAGQERQIRWQQLRHLQNIQQYVFSEFNGRIENYTDAFCEFLQGSNFNTEGFLGYCKSSVRQLIDQQEGPEAIYNRLCDLEKILKISHEKADAKPYEARLPGVKEAMLAYVKAEMDCLRKKERGMAKPVIVLNAPAAAKPDGAADSEKLCMNLSVDVLVCFYRMLIETGTVTNPAKSSVFRFLSKHVQTPGSVDREISLKSLENKYKQLEQSTLDNTRTLLLKMIQKLDEKCA